MRHTVSFVAVAAAALALSLAAANATDAASAAVSIRDLSFMPPSVTINVGEAVTWTNLDGIKHSATADGGSFDTGIFEAGSRAVTFARVGSFSYHCVVHPFMRGSVLVVGPTPPPTFVPAPTPVPASTPVPAPVATAPPAVATPTVPAVSPTPTASPEPSPTPTATPSPTFVAQVTATTSVPTAAATTSSRSDEGPGPALVGGAIVALVAIAGAAWLIVRRPG